MRLRGLIVPTLAILLVSLLAASAPAARPVPSGVGHSASLLPPAGWTGDFGNEIRSPAGNISLSLALAKLANHTNMDMVVANAGDDTIGVYFGNGDGTFQAPVLYSAGLIAPAAIAIGDVNGDGIPDIVVANYNNLNLTGDNTVAVFLGNADGTFQAPSSYTIGAHAYSVVLANFDGQLDIVTADQADNTISFLSGNGDGTFKPRVTFAAGTGPVALAAADFNGDGNLDLAVVDCPPWASWGCAEAFPGSTGGAVMVLLGNGHGSFTAQPAIPVAAYPTAVAAADLNGDGHPDLVIAAGGNVTVLLGNGDGTFGAPSVLPAGNANTIAIADFNGDGHLDIAAYGGSVFSEMLGNGDGTFQPPVNYGYPMATGLGLTAGDLNGDGKPDLVMINSQNIVSSFLNVSGSARAATSISVVASPSPAVTTSSITVASTLTASPLPSGTVTLALDGVPALGGAVNSSGGSGAGFGANPNTGSTLAVGTHTITAVYSGNSATQASTASIPLVVNLTPTSTTIASTPNPAAPGTVVEFDACTSGGDVGTVSFYDGTTLLDTVPLGERSDQNCNATEYDTTFTTSQLAIGTHAITAVYSGSAVYAASTSSVLTQTIAVPTPDFVFAASSGPQTVTAGGDAVFNIWLGPVSGNNWKGTVSLSCAGAPAFSSCVLWNTSVDISPYGTVATMATVRTSGPTTMAARAPPAPRRSHTLEAVLCATLAVVDGRRGVKRRVGRRIPALALVLAPLLLLGLLAACGGGGGGSGGNSGDSVFTPAGTYTIVITGTVGSVSHSLNLTLIVQQ